MNNNNNWFDTVFLPSFDNRMSNPNYPNQCILSEKQADICRRYMTESSAHDSDYKKDFIYLTYAIGGTNYIVEYRGRYTFLKKWFKAYKPTGADRIRIKRLNRNEVLYNREYD